MEAIEGGGEGEPLLLSFPFPGMLNAWKRGEGKRRKDKQGKRDRSG